MTTIYTNMSFVPMKEAPELDKQERAKVVSTTYYGEEVRVIAREGEWRQIRTEDGYKGWVKANTLIELPRGYYGSGEFVKTARCAAHIYDVMDTEYGPILTLPYGCRLKVIDQSHPRWLTVVLLDGQEAYVQRGDVTLQDKPLTTVEEAIEFSKRFLHLPYTWGGRTSFGFDCSGFVQFIFREMGRALPRDARDQCSAPVFASIDLQDVQAGDLVFFGNSGTDIIHVGFCYGNQTFVHATVRENMPWIRISTLQDKEWSSEGSHKFRAARRYIG